MEQMLKNAFLGIFNDEDMEYLIPNNMLIDRDDIQREQNNFSLANFTDEEIRLNFRFERNDISHIVEALRTPADVINETGNEGFGDF